jgi:hypothetical protein
MPKREFIKKTEIVVLLLLLVFVLLGCESFPKPRSEEDTLFVVPVVYLDSQTTTSSRISFGYRLAMENVQTGKIKHITIDSSDPYEIVRNWDEGEYLLKEYSSIGFVDNWTNQLQINQYLKVEKGKVTVFPCKVVIILFESSNLLYDTSIAVDFIELDKDDQERVLEFLSTYENFHLWGS